MAVISTRTPSAFDEARIVPVRHNWDSAYRMSLEFKTDIITSGNGKEQRRAVRELPRYTFDLSADLTPAEKRGIDMLMAQWGAKQMVMGLEHFSLRMKDWLAPEQTAVQIVPEAETPLSPKAGDTVLLAHYDLRETRTAAGISKTIASFVEESLSEFPPGTQIMPAVRGWLQTDATVTRVTNEVGQAAFTFTVAPESLNSVPAVGTPEYVGAYEVFMKRPNWGQDVDVSYITPRQTVDYGFGRIEQFIPNDYPSWTRQASYVGRTIRETYEAVNFFVRHKGRWKEFLQPTWENDVPFTALAGGGLSILVAGQAFGETYRDSTVFRRIMVRYRDGSFSHHLIDFIEPLPDTESSVIWLTEALPVSELTRENVIGISWVLVSRFASDKMDVDFLTNEVAQFTLTTQTLENFEL